MIPRRRTLAWMIPAAAFALAAVLSFLAASGFQDSAAKATAQCRAAGGTTVSCMWSGYEQKLAGEALFWLGFGAALASAATPFLGRWYDARATGPPMRGVPVRRA